MGRRVLAVTDSTNAEAARIAAGGLVAPEWILALQQTAARGRRGRSWVNPEGNFSATLVMFPKGPPEQAALRSFIAALALADALSCAIGRNDGISLKWPNDVLLNGGKVAGILLESASSGTGLTHLAIGVGVNLILAPDPDQVEPDAQPPISVMEATGLRLSPEEFLDLLAPAYAAREADFAARGFGPIRDAWLARAARLGQNITARTGRTCLQGVFETVDDSGALVLKTADGPVAITAAQVFF